MSQEFIATGRRKTAVARIRMTPGSGKIEVNGRPFEEYFPTASLQSVVRQPSGARAIGNYELGIGDQLACVAGGHGV